MTTVSKSVELSQLDLKKVTRSGYTAQGSLYVYLVNRDDPHFVVVNGDRIRKGKTKAFQKALDSDEANDKLDELISDADDD